MYTRRCRNCSRRYPQCCRVANIARKVDAFLMPLRVAVKWRGEECRIVVDMVLASKGDGVEKPKFRNIVQYEEQENN